MRVLLLGCNGQLGAALLKSTPEHSEIAALDRDQLDITDDAAVRRVCASFRPELVINAAAYTAVDRAENELDVCRAVNADGPRIVATAAGRVGARLIHVSTDFVFDGTSAVPYKPDDPTGPLSVYGQTKRDGERAVLEILRDASVLLRTAWVYSNTGSNFVLTMLRLMRERSEISVVSDQVGTPTWANSLASTVWAFANAPTVSGVFHWTDAGQTNWRDFAVAICEEAVDLGILDETVRVNAISTAEYPTTAVRPRYSVLDCSKTIAALGLRQKAWRSNLRNMLLELEI